MEDKGDNLTTKYSYNNGNAKIEIGLKDKPTFKQVKVTEEAKEGNDVINKSYFRNKKYYQIFQLNLKFMEIVEKQKM